MKIKNSFIGWDGNKFTVVYESSGSIVENSKYFTTNNIVGNLVEIKKEEAFQMIDNAEEKLK